MTNRKTTKRSLLMSGLALLICVTMLIGTTFAWFTDSVTSGTNKIVAGNLDVELYHADKAQPTDELVGSTTKLFDDVTLWEPGAMVWEKLTVKNVGSLDLKYTLKVNVTDISVVNGKSLADVLKVAVLDEQPTRDNIKTAATESLDSFALNSDKALKNGDSDVVYMAIYWAPSANDNDYNVAGEALYANLGVTLLATQLASESDSFDNTYDNKAVYEEDVQVEAQPWHELDAVHSDKVVDGGGYTYATDYQEVCLAGDADITIKGVTFQNGLTLYTNNTNSTGTITLEDCVIYLNDGKGNPKNEMLNMHYADYGLYIGAISPNVNYEFKRCKFTAYDTHTYTNNDKGYNVYIGGNYSAGNITFDDCTFEKSSKHGIGCSFAYIPNVDNNIATYYNLKVTGCNFVDWNNGNYNGAAIRGNVPADVLATFNKSISISNNTFGDNKGSTKSNVAIDDWNGKWN